MRRRSERDGMCYARERPVFRDLRNVHYGQRVTIVL